MVWLCKSLQEKFMTQAVSPSPPLSGHFKALKAMFRGVGKCRTRRRGRMIVSRKNVRVSWRRNTRRGDKTFITKSCMETEGAGQAPPLQSIIPRITSSGAGQQRPLGPPFGKVSPRGPSEAPFGKVTSEAGPGWKTGSPADLSPIKENGESNNPWATFARVT